MENKGLRNEQIISELQLSGSLAIKTKTESGIHYFMDKSPDDGIISGKLNSVTITLFCIPMIYTRGLDCGIP